MSHESEPDVCFSYWGRIVFCFKGEGKGAAQISGITAYGRNNGYERSFYEQLSIVLLLVVVKIYSVQLSEPANHLTLIPPTMPIDQFSALSSDSNAV